MIYSGQEVRNIKAIFRHTINFYSVLEAQAVDEDGLKVFRGHPTSVVTDEMELPGPYYTAMRQNLLTLGCVKQLERGSGKSLSVWVLVKAPTEEDFNSVDPNGGNKRIDTHTFRLYQTSTDAAIENIEERLGGVNVARALADLQQSINDLSQEIRSIKQQQGEK